MDSGKDSCEPTVNDARMPRVERFAGWLNLSVIAIGIVFFLARNLGNDAIWDAESDGVLRSLGYPSGYENRGLSDVLEGTRHTNDAGGFDVLLHGWMQLFGTGIFEIRVLPAIFFLVYLLAMLALGRRLRLPLWAGAAVICAMLLENITPYYAAEIRPYMPMLATSVAMLALAGWLSDRPGAWRSIGFIAAAAILLSQHYNGFGIAFATAIVLGMAAWRRESRQRLWLIVVLVFTLVWLPTLYLALRGSPFAPHERIWYLDAVMLRFADPQQWWHILTWNFLTPTGLPRTVFLLLVPVLWILARRGHGSRPFAAVIVAWVYVLAATAAAAGMSVLGFLPWYLGTRWAISDVGLIAISLLGLAAIILPWLRRGPVWIVGAAVAVSVLVAGTGSWRLAHYDRGGPVGYLKQIGPEMLAGGPGSLTVDGWLYWNVRYLIERSGAYDELQPGWNQNREDVISSPIGAEPQQVRDFLASSRTRMLLRSVDPLKGVELPSNLEIISVAGDAGPTLLVKH